VYRTGFELRLEKKNVKTKMLRMLLTVVAATVILLCRHPALAADTTIPTGTATVVPPNTTLTDLSHQLRGVPINVQTLIMTFDQTRDKYLQQQRLLLIKLHRATPQDQDQVRQQLQANRQDFLTELKGFREELRTDLQALKGKISHAEFGRIIDAAHSASTGTGGGHRHRGQ
jgi:hypothetical protein